MPTPTDRSCERCAFSIPTRVDEVTYDLRDWVCLVDDEAVSPYATCEAFHFGWPLLWPKMSGHEKAAALVLKMETFRGP